jgi:hypothetical protein
MLDSIDTEHMELHADRDTGLDPETGAWIAEAIRLFVEASDRFADGELQAAMSSLAAVPRLHHLLVDRCVELIEVEPAPSEDVPLPGMYL